MLIVVLRILGWLGIIFCGINSAIKIFGSKEMVLEYAGSNRHLGTNFLALAICIIFLALAAIISRLDKILVETKDENNGGPNNG